MNDRSAQPAMPIAGGRAMASAGISIELRDQVRRCGEPVSFGLPWPRGLIRDAQCLCLTDNTGRIRALQARPLSRWPDGSWRWVLIDLLADTHDAPYRIDCREHVANRPHEHQAITVNQSDAGVAITTGRSRFVISPHGPFPFQLFTTSDGDTITPGSGRLQLTWRPKRQASAQIEQIRVNERGPIRTVVHVQGRLGPLQLFTDLHFFAGLDTVRFDLTVRNPRRARHRQNKWTLGDRNSVLLDDLHLNFTLPTTQPEPTPNGQLNVSLDAASPLERFNTPLTLYQDSSGCNNWQSPNHINRTHQSPCRIRGYQLSSPGDRRNGHHATPIISLDRSAQHLAIAVPQFWQQFPKAIEATDESLTLRLFPQQSAGGHEIQGGEQKTHTFFVAFYRDHVTEIPLHWCRSPLKPTVDPAFFADASAAPYLTVRPAIRRPDRMTVRSTDRVKSPREQYQSLINAAIEGDDTFEHKRRLIDEYGWRHFGDVYADHEAVGHTGRSPLISHYNNQYDCLAGFARQYMQTGDTRWLDLMNDLARHVADIDVYHTDEDKSAYNHGMFWHTCHYIDAGTSTHRTYPRIRQVSGGGPCGGHLYTTGLLLHYFLTGSQLSRQTVIELGQYVIGADDGSRTIFRFLDGSETGHVTQSGFHGHHGPGRAAANALNALLDAHQLTDQTRFIQKAEQIVRRAVHPDDDIEALNLLDTENKWFYTMFLQSLGKYLDHQAERNECGRMYAYARHVLLRYADWMAEHESPYLDLPEKPTYPTETWAAQDMRKSDVFYLAARHAEGPRRRCFVERGTFFFEDSVNKLASMPTRTLCRPVVLLLTNGMMHLHHQTRGITPAQQPDDSYSDFGRPEVFVPQKQRIKNRLKRFGKAASFALVAALGHSNPITHA